MSIPRALNSTEIIFQIKKYLKKNQISIKLKRKEMKTKKINRKVKSANRK